ncbi:MAG: hypothetical protein RLZZ501_2648 [Pseudomonadota bacterium]
MSKKKKKNKGKKNWTVCPVTGRRVPPGYVYAPQGGAGTGLLAGLGRLLPSGRTEQFLVGAAIGAAAAYVLSDDELRGKLLASGVKLYNGLLGGIEEVKEQIADIQAEMQSGQGGVD